MISAVVQHLRSPRDSKCGRMLIIRLHHRVLLLTHEITPRVKRAADNGLTY